MAQNGELCSDAPHRTGNGSLQQEANGKHRTQGAKAPTYEYPWPVRLLWPVARPVLYPCFYWFCISYPFYGAYLNVGACLALLVRIVWQALYGASFPIWTTIVFVLHILSAAFPIKTDDAPAWMQPILDEGSRLMVDYFPIRLHFEDKDVFRGDKRYIVTLEPHSVLPVGLPGCFLPNRIQRCRLPPALQPVYSCVSSAVFALPVLGTMWYWWGARTVDKPTVTRILRSGANVALTPGGVKECLYMAPGKETLYMRRRLGLAKLALTTGAAVVPVFAFNQTKTMGFVRPGPPLVPQCVVTAVSRSLGFVPVLMRSPTGWPAPGRVAVDVVVGRPVEVKGVVADPTERQLRAYLEEVVREMTALFERHKAEHGCADLKLEIL